MSGQHAALLEAMEQQMISVCKAGVVCSMPARTAVLAAANPVGGHYNRAKTVSENLKLGPALLSRFDLVFILIDKPDDVQVNERSSNILKNICEIFCLFQDSLLSEHVMSFHTRQTQGARSRQVDISQRLGSNNSASASNTRTQTLVERLTPVPSEIVDPLPPQCLKKIHCLRKKIWPSPLLV